MTFVTDRMIVVLQDYCKFGVLIIKFTQYIKFKIVFFFSKLISIIELL